MVLAVTQKTGESRLRSRRTGLCGSGFVSLWGNICNFRGLPFTRWGWSSKNSISCDQPADGGSPPAPGAQGKWFCGRLRPLMGPGSLPGISRAAPRHPEGRCSRVSFTRASPAPSQALAVGGTKSYLKRVKCGHVDQWTGEAWS